MATEAPLKSAPLNRDSCKAVILDMDGVLTQTAQVHAQAWATMFNDYLHGRESEPTARSESCGGQSCGGQSFEIDRDYRSFVDGKPRQDGVASFLESRDIHLPLGDPQDEPGKETIWGLGNRKNQIFQQLLERDGVEVYEDAVEQIARWKREGMKLAVVSSSRNCEAVLQAAKLAAAFDAKVDGNDLARQQLRGKPAADMFLDAARRLGVGPAEAMVVEDAIAGVQAGRGGGFGMVVGVARDGQAAELRRAGADCVVQDLREIPSGGSARERPSRPLPASEQAAEIAGRIRGKRLALFLDYDGTLTPIVRRPEAATLSDEMRSLLAAVAEHCMVAIISGRDRRDAENMVQIDRLVYAGSHGFDIRGPGGLQMQQPDAVQALPDLDQAEQKLRQRIARIDGGRVERKKFAIAVHYREVGSEAEVQRVEEAVDAVVGDHPGLRKRGGKKIFELQPDVPWDKGRAVEWLCEVLGFDLDEDAVLYLGDDVTDEDAFHMLRSHPRGIGIRVAEPAEPAVQTEASYSLRDCDEVKDFLQSLLVILQEPRADW